MMKELRKHPLDYLLLLVVMSYCLFGFFAAWPNKQAQQLYALALALAYFFWGIVHHTLEKNVTIRVVLEYFFISLFAGSTLFLLTV